MEKPADFWDYIDALVRTSQIVIDRPRGSRHPRFPDLIYPLDYGYLKARSAPMVVKLICGAVRW